MPSPYSTPNVYIEEISPTGPIEGIGTSTAGFIGPARKGPLSVPTRVTSWTQFKDTFGDYIPSYYLAHAVEGFFKNGGTMAYVVRVGTAKNAFKLLADRAGGNTLRVEALAEGTTPGNTISVQVQDAQIATNATALKAEGAMASSQSNSIKLASAQDTLKFRPGDTITIQGTNERAVIDYISGDELFLTSTLAGTPAAATVRIANLIPTQTTFRVSGMAGLEAGSVIQIQQGNTKETATVAKVQAGFVTLASGLTNTYSMATGDTAVAIQTLEFTLVIRAPRSADTTYEKLSMDPRHSRYFGRSIDSTLVRVTSAEPPSTAPAPNNRPAVLAATNLSGGTDDDILTLTSTDYVNAIDAFLPVQDVNILAIPDRADVTVQQALIAHCERMNNRFAILDSSRGAPLSGLGSVSAQRKSVDSKKGYAALYYPWLSIADPQTGASLLVPPSGFIAGTYARVDQQRGVHKAPANEMITGAFGLEREFSDTDMGILNTAGIDVIRTFPNRTRPTIWGARTTAPQLEAPWRYVNVRRLFIYVEESIRLGIRWSVFEPNDLALWEKLKRTIGEFLNRVWRSGALFGATAAEAYYVKCDEELNPPSVRALGQVFVEVGIAPVRPAEFVIIRIGMWDDGSKVSEG